MFCVDRAHAREQQGKFEQAGIPFGYIDGTITHNWHGKKSLRSYNDRWEILTRNQFDPNIDLVLDANGLYQLTDEKPQMRDDFAHYFARRNEDGVDMD